jgi:signal transduction histidine kinase
MNPSTQIVIGPDGAVLGATGELSAGLAHFRLEECEALPREIRDAGKSLLVELRSSRSHVVTRTVALGGGDRLVELVALEALAIRRAPADVRQLLTSKLGVLASQAAGSEITLSIVVADDVPAVVFVDVEKLAWSVTTLVGSALRYMRSTPRRVSGRTINVAAAVGPVPGELMIEVKDDGPGISSDTVTRLFKRDGLNVRGTGLALLLMSDICVAHGGAIDVRSSTEAPDHGTTVRLTLPGSWGSD